MSAASTNNILKTISYKTRTTNRTTKSESLEWRRLVSVETFLTTGAPSSPPYLRSIYDGACSCYPPLRWGLIEPVPGRAARCANSSLDDNGRCRRTRQARSWVAMLTVFRVYPAPRYQKTPFPQNRRPLRVKRQRRPAGWVVLRAAPFMALRFIVPTTTVASRARYHSVALAFTHSRLRGAPAPDHARLGRDTTMGFGRRTSISSRRSLVRSVRRMWLGERPVAPRGWCWSQISTWRSHEQPSARITHGCAVVGLMEP